MTKEKLENREYFYRLCLIEYLYERTKIRKIELEQMTILELVKKYNKTKKEWIK